MGKRGPNTKPTPLRVLEGNPGKRRIPAEPTPDRGSVEPPSDLPEPAAAIWRRLAPELEAKGLLAPRYLETFEVFCRTFPQWRRAAHLVELGGPVIKGRRDEMVSNPASREFVRFGAMIRAFGSDFGLSPASLSEIARAEDQRNYTASDPARFLP